MNIHQQHPYYNPEAMLFGTPPAEQLAQPDIIEPLQPEEFEAPATPFDQNPDLAMDMAADQLFLVADQHLQEQALHDSPLEEADQTRKRSGYNGVAVDIGTGEFLSIERLSDTEQPLPGKPRTIITKPVEKGTYNGIEYSQTERYIEGPDGKWHKEVDVDLGAGADSVFGTSKIHEEMPPDSEDMRSVYNSVHRPNNIRRLQQNKTQVAGNGAGLSQRATT